VHAARNLQGVPLIEQVIERVHRDPHAIASFCNDYPLAKPRPLAPELLERLTFPIGKPLSPSLTRWLACDASWLESQGWFAAGQEGVFTPRRIDQIVTAEFEALWGEMYEPLSDRMGECFLPPSCIACPEVPAAPCSWTMCCPPMTFASTTLCGCGRLGSLCTAR
jgi:hypothetical protein